jgi:hypothetical protein
MRTGAVGRWLRGIAPERKTWKQDDFHAGLARD